MELTATCQHCRKFQVTHIAAGKSTLACAECGKNLIEYMTEATRREDGIEQCPVCGAAHTYRQKDFNRKIGIALVILGVGLAYFTYGISLVAVTLIDWLLVRRVGEVGCCYQCGAQFRETPLIDKMEPFNLSLYDYYRNLKR